VSAFESSLQGELESLRRQGLRRELRRIDSAPGPRVQSGGGTLLNFSSNDYLGLAGHPAVREAALQAVRDFGAGAGAARLICGSLAPHHDLEDDLAAFKGTPAALAFSSGYAAAVGTISALLGPEDYILIDRLVHACCVDAARLCGAKLRVFRHNDPGDLERILQWARARSTATAGAPGARAPRILIVTESVFSMDGDLAPLRDIVELKDRHGAWLMLDEAHATGLFGERRCGLAEATGVADRVEVQMGTLGKALGASGGYIAGSRSLIDLLVHRARSFIFSTAPPPAAVGAARAGLRLVSSPEGAALRQTLWQRVDEAKNALIRAGRALAPVQSPIVPIPVGAEDAAVQLAAQLRGRGLLIPAIRYPTVARGEARLRLTVSAAHRPGDLQELERAFLGLPFSPSPDAPAGPA
jgi:8-amino-7-oxononanoate synthase